MTLGTISKATEHRKKEKIMAAKKRTTKRIDGNAQTSRQRQATRICDDILKAWKKIISCGVGEAS